MTGEPREVAAEPWDWYAGLPGVVAGAAALIRDDGGRILLVKPNYRDYWSLPGGVCEHGEPPQDGCAREVAEELGLRRQVGRLLAIDWSQPFGLAARPILHFIFDGATLGAAETIVLQQEELDDFRFAPAAELAAYLPPFAMPRVSAAIAALSSGCPIFVPHPAG